MASNYVAQLRRLLRGTPLAPHARLIAQVESRNRLPRGSIAGIAKAESSFGTAGSPTRGFNAWGWTNGGPPNFRSFPNWQTAIRQYGRFLGSNYGDALRSGGPGAIERRYVGYSAPDWTENVRSVMSQFGGGVPDTPTTRPGRGGRGGRAGSRRGRASGNQDTRMQALFALILMRRASRSGGGSTALMLPLIQTLLDDRPDKTRPGRRGRTRAPGGQGPPSVQPELYRAGNGFLLPQPGFRTSHATSGLAGYPAFDFMIPDGTPVYADFSGRLEGGPNGNGLSGHSGYSNGFGGRSYYITTDNGRKLFLTHFDYGRTVLKGGQRIQRGQLLGYVQPGAAHIHYGYGG